MSRLYPHPKAMTVLPAFSMRCVVLFENWVAADVHPVVLLGRNVACLAVGLVVRRHVARGLIRHEQGQPQPSPHRSLPGNRPFESLTITNQTLMSVDQADCPVVSFSELTWVISFTSTAPSGNFPSRRYSRTSSGRE